MKKADQHTISDEEKIKWNTKDGKESRKEEKGEEKRGWGDVCATW